MKPQHSVFTLVSLLALALILGACDAMQDSSVAPTESLLASGPQDHHSAGGEIWVTAQDASQIKIVRGMGFIETIQLPAGSGPHEVTFSPGGDYAYVANVANGTFIAIRAQDREILQIIDMGDEGGGDTGTHQAMASPDGSIVLVADIPSRILWKIAADEAAEQWNVVDNLQLPDGPICTAFRADGQRAYVSLAAQGIAVVDPINMELLEVLPTDGSAQCGVVNSKHDDVIYVDSRGVSPWLDGNFYLLDTTSDELTLFNAFPALDLHGFGVSASEKQAFIAERNGDALIILDLTDPSAEPERVSLDVRPGVADMPDKVAVRGNTAYATIRTSGDLAVVKQNGNVKYIHLVEPSANALHGVAIR